MIDIILWIFLVGDIIGAGLLIHNIGKPRIMTAGSASVSIICELVVWIALILKLIGVR